MQPICEEIWDSKYRLKDTHGQPIDDSIDDTWRRVARALADVEQLPDTWYPKFLWALQNGAIPAGRIVSNAGARAHKPATSLINCTVSGAIDDSMDGIMTSLHEAALTLKAGCVAPGTQVFTDRGLTTADAAVEQGHQQILCYDRERGRFEMRAIERHLRVNVPRDENIEIRSNGTTLVTSIKHPVLVYRDGRLLYVRADEVCMEDGLVHHHFPWDAPMERTQEAWFAGAHLGDGSAYPKRIDYHPSRSAWRQRAEAAGQRLVFKIRAAGREVVERYAHFFQRFYDCQANVVQAVTPNNTPVWDFTVASFKASAASGLFDNQCGKKSHTLHIPAWIAAHPERHFLPFLAGIVDTDGTVSTERGSVIIATASQRFTAELANLLALFGVHAGITQSCPRSHDYRGKTIVDRGGWTVKISDSDFLRIVASYMADSGKKRRIHDHASQAGQYDRYRLPQSLRAALETEWDRLGHTERQQLGFYHGYHRATAVSRIWLDRWQARFPHLAELIDFARTLRPVEGIRRNLPIAATFYDFTVERHNNYLAGNGGMMVIHNCGIGYEFSTLRPRGAHVSGAGASTSGPLLFMDIFDAMCATVSSAGGRRGAQMGTFDIRHPDVVEFIKAKRVNGRLRKFNLSLLVTDAFMRAVEEDGDWVLEFPGYSDVQKKLKARELWDLIMRSTYDYAEPGVLFIDQLNRLNNNWFCEDIRATNPCGEQGLPFYGACLLGSIDLTKFVEEPFTISARFDLDRYKRVVAIFTRMLDNVVEIANLPLPKQREELRRKRRHGMGVTGLGSALALLGIRYGSPGACSFTEVVMRNTAEIGWRVGVELAKEKGPAPIMDELFEVTPAIIARFPSLAGESLHIGDEALGKHLFALGSYYLDQLRGDRPDLIQDLRIHGSRFTHHTSIAPTGTISLAFANNASNGIEPSFSHRYFRNLTKQGRKTREQVEVFSAEAHLWRELHGDEPFPKWFVTADEVTPKEHIDVQAAAQKWVDSSISKTINIPSDYPYEEFKEVYQYAYEQGLKGCATFRFNPEMQQGVLVKEKDLGNTQYRFTLADGSTVDARGNEEIEYEGETHSAANLFDAIKEGTYGRF